MKKGDNFVRKSGKSEIGILGDSPQLKAASPNRVAGVIRVRIPAEYVGGRRLLCIRGSMRPATAGRFGGLPGLRPHPPYIDCTRRHCANERGERDTEKDDD